MRRISFLVCSGLILAMGCTQSEGKIIAPPMTTFPSAPGGGIVQPMAAAAGVGAPPKSPAKPAATKPDESKKDDSKKDDAKKDDNKKDESKKDDKAGKS